MRHARTLLLSIGAVIAYCLIAALLNLETAARDISRIILFTVLVFLWLMAKSPDRKFFS